MFGANLHSVSAKLVDGAVKRVAVNNLPTAGHYEDFQPCS